MVQCSNLDRSNGRKRGMILATVPPADGCATPDLARVCCPSFGTVSVRRRHSKIALITATGEPSTPIASLLEPRGQCRHGKERRQSLGNKSGSVSLCCSTAFVDYLRTQNKKAPWAFPPLGRHTCQDYRLHLLSLC